MLGIYLGVELLGHMVNSRVQPSEETPGLSIHFLDAVLLRIKAFQCDQGNLLMSSLAVCALVPYLENHCLTQVMKIYVFSEVLQFHFLHLSL